MQSYIYPEFKKNLLIKEIDKPIPELSLYRYNKKLKKIGDILELENSLAKENYEYNNYQYNKLGKDKYLELKKYKLFSYTKNYESDFNYPKGWSNAYRKIYEICTLTNFVPKRKNLLHFDICSFPGSFIYGLHDYIKTKKDNTTYDFLFQSYLVKGEEKNKYFEDRYRLAKKYPRKFIVKDNGDVTSIKVIEYYQEYFKNIKCDIITSDCGLESEKKDSFEREKQMTKTFLGMLIIALSALKKNGNLLMKYYHFYSIFNLSLIYFLGLVFKSVYLVKPSSSRQFSGSEVYIMCLDFKANLEIKDIEKLKGILSKFNQKTLNYSLINSKNLDSNILNNIEEKLFSYYKYKIERRLQKFKLTDDFIKVSWEEDYNLYLKKYKLLSKISNNIEKKWYKNYLKHMDITILDKKDSL